MVAADKEISAAYRLFRFRFMAGLFTLNMRLPLLESWLSKQILTAANKRIEERNHGKTAGQRSRSLSWYQNAIIYELHVRAFKDSNGDGIGDFQGLIQETGLSAGSRRHLCMVVAFFFFASQRRWL